MAYIYENISPENYEKFKLDEAAKKVYWHLKYERWIYDADKEIFLIRMDSLRDETDSWAYLFHFKGQFIRFCLFESDYSKNADGSINSTWNYGHDAARAINYHAKLLNVPVEEINAELKLALQEHSFGLPDRARLKCHLTFTF